MGSTKSPTDVDLSRRSICLSQPEPNAVIHEGNHKFKQELGKYYSAEESQAIEGLLELKDALKSIPNDDDFWAYLSERMAEILGGQLSFISKRILVDEQDAAVEMPPIGEPGACLMASAFHYNDGKGTSDTLKAFKYHAYGCPCAYMRHDKVFIIPEKLNIHSPNNPNELPFACDAYIGIPLFSNGKCFAHFGVMWSDEGAKQRTLSWAVLELLLHSLEDVILDRLLGGTHFSGGDIQSRDRSRIIPHDAVTAAQSLKPYARSLSHELRTPMQGVVGMLDVMYATVLEAAEGQRDPEVRKVFETLRENIEIVQDSSRRAVEAADNVVHAYDMDLHVPDAHPTVNTDISRSGSINTAPTSQHERPNILVAGSNLPIERPNKRRRPDEVPTSSDGSPAKIQATRSAWAHRSEPSEDLKRGVHEAEELPGLNTPTLSGEPFDATGMPSPPKSDLERSVAPGLRHTQLRNVLQYVVNEGLKIGGRPESAIARETDYGEIIEVRTKNPNGEERQKLVEWYVDSAVPETIFVDERDLGKLVSCVFLNAIKFTSQGRITVTARMSAQGRHVVIKVSDSGPGIPAAFLPKLFKPFSQEDGSLTRQSEGLGLGLLVAKGIARKLGGDLVCTRAETSGIDHGSDFEVRFPVSPGDQFSRPSSPFRASSAVPTPATKKSTSPPAIPVNTAKAAGRTAEKDFETPRRPSLDASMRSNTMPPPRPVPLFTLPFAPASPSLADGHKRPPLAPRKSSATIDGIDKNLASKYPLTFLVAEDNKINRKLLVSMLTKFGYKNVHEAYDGAEAVRQMEKHRMVDVVLMDLWMPFMDGYEATEKILNMQRADGEIVPTVLAVTADVTDGALEKAAKVGMRGFMTKPFKLLDLQRLILEYCSQQDGQDNRYKSDESGPSSAANGSAPPSGTPVACP